MPIGPLIGADDVCVAVEATLQTWLPSVLDEIAAVGKPRPADPKTYEQLPTETASTTAEYPAVIVSSPGLSGRPEHYGDGTWTATWAVVVTCALRAESYRETAAAVRNYVLALRTCLTQHGAVVAGQDCSALYTDEMYARAADSAARTFGIGHVVFDVRVESVMDDTAGAVTVPTPPDLTPLPPDVINVDITL